MAHWNEKVDITDLHEAYDTNDKSVEEIAKEVHTRLMKTRCAKDDEFEKIVSDLLVIDDIDDYNDILTAVYDYGDSGHRLWVKAY